MKIHFPPGRAVRLRYGIALAALSAGMAPTGALARADSGSLDVLNAADLRLASVGYRLATANAHRCAAPTMLTGLILHDLGEYKAGERQVVAAHYDLHDGIGVVGVVAGSVADKAGLRKGDEIVSIDGADVRVVSAALPNSASYTRVESAVRAIQAGATRGAAKLGVRRGAETIDVALGGISGCGGEIVLAPSRVLNAWSDGSHVVVTTRLLAMAASDDELAFVVAHEMSHNNLKHQEKLGSAVNGLFAAFGRTAARIKDTEIEADTSAIGLMAAAGFRLDSAADFLKRAGKGRVLEIATTHPGTGRRIQIVTAAVQAVTTAPVEFAMAEPPAWRPSLTALLQPSAPPGALSMISASTWNASLSLASLKLTDWSASLLAPLSATTPFAAKPLPSEQVFDTSLALPRFTAQPLTTPWPLVRTEYTAPGPTGWRIMSPSGYTAILNIPPGGTRTCTTTMATIPIAVGAAG